MSTESKKIMLFGVFDNLHDGHRFFLTNASLYGQELYIVVTPTKTVQKMKNKLPFYSIKERMSALGKEYPTARIIEGDTDPNLWTPILDYKPDLIICGYDQSDLYEALEKVKEVYNFELTKIEKNFKGSELHSRYINKGV